MLLDWQKVENLKWLKNLMKICRGNISIHGELEFINGVCYGDKKTVRNWKKIIPRNCWKMLSDETKPIVVPPPALPDEDAIEIPSYDPDYAKEYIKRKADKYELKKKIQLEAYHAGMTYGQYRKKYYPNFTFKDEPEVIFSHKK
jgi:hypothetical protein